MTQELCGGSINSRYVRPNKYQAMFKEEVNKIFKVFSSIPKLGKLILKFKEQIDSEEASNF